MRLSELDYDLPEDLIAQEPLERRDGARMLVLDRRQGSVEHSRFYKIGRYLREKKPGVRIGHVVDALWASYSGEML